MRLSPAIALGLVLGAAPAAAQDAAQGKSLFQRQCAACHQVTSARNGVGPSLQGVVGRAAGSAEGFKYSPALKSSGISWTPETLGTFLADPSATVKGARMVQRVPSEKDRKDIIAYLSGL